MKRPAFVALAVLVLAACQDATEPELTTPGVSVTYHAVPVVISTFTVTNTGDAGSGSLRQAILDANGSAGTDLIDFNIPAASDAGCNVGTGVCTIQPLSGLPAITDPAVIDGYTQSGASANTNAPELGSNAVLKIELDGSMASTGPPPPSVHGFVIAAGGSTVRGLVINRFVTGSGIRFSTPTAGIGGEGGNVVEGNFIGTDVTGTASLGNFRAVVIFNPNNRIGGTTPAARNVISGNDNAGVFILGAGATGSLLQGNFIGTDVTGTGPLGNSLGVFITFNASDNTIGGVDYGASNTIAFNGSGVFVFSGTGNAILSNSIFSNAGLGIDLIPGGVTPNDAGDGDTGANNLQNFPVLTSATGDNDHIRGELNSTANTDFRLEFFANTACDPSGHGEGQLFIRSMTVTTDVNGDVSFRRKLNVGEDDDDFFGRFITATATDPNGNTSEFSNCILYRSRFIGQVGGLIRPPFS